MTPGTIDREAVLIVNDLERDLRFAVSMMATASRRLARLEDQTQGLARESLTSGCELPDRVRANLDAIDVTITDTIAAELRALDAAVADIRQRLAWWQNFTRRVVAVALDLQAERVL